MKHDVRTEAELELSLSEITALSARAARGAGRSWGEAEEVGEAACWLARAGQDWAGAVLEVLDAPEDSGDCALRVGIVLADTAALSVPIKTKLPMINSPFFLLPFAARLADQTGRRIRLDWADTQVVLAPGACPSSTGSVGIAGPAQVMITPECQDKTLCPDWPPTHRGTALATQYARLMQFMMASTVPTSASSLAGAGAGGNDDD